MKKTIGILVIMITMFIGINNVGATSETYEGTCSLAGYSTTGCNYECNFSVNGDSITFAFDLNNEDGTEIVYSSEIKDYKLSDGCDIYSYTEENELLGATCNYEIGDDKGATDYVNYKIVSYPSKDYFEDSVYDFACRPIKATMYAETSLSDSFENYGRQWSVYDKKFNISIKQASGDDVVRPIVDNSCGLLGSKDSQTVVLIKKLYRYIKILIPIIIVVLSIVDFLKIVFSGKDDDMKKAINNFGKRIIIAVIFVLVPTLISIIIDISGVTEQHSGINDGLKTVFCILE